VFLAALDNAVRDSWAGVGELATRLEEVVAAARTAWPDLIEPGPEAGPALVAYLAARIPADTAPDQVLASLRPADLALARACATAVPGAIERCEAAMFDEVDAAWSRFRDPGLGKADLRQAMRHHLFVATTPDQPPRIATYQGRGELRAWVRMAATRFMLDEVRARAARPDRPGAGDDELAALATAADDPELGFLKRQYRAEFRAAFGEALATLDARARNILRHRYLDGLDVAALATLYDLHRVSMSRTLARIRDELHAEIRRAFMRRLRVDRAEFDSIMALIGSQLEVSLSGLLASTDRAR